MCMVKQDLKYKKFVIIFETPKYPTMTLNPPNYPLTHPFTHLFIHPSTQPPIRSSALNRDT